MIHVSDFIKVDFYDLTLGGQSINRLFKNPFI